MIVAIGWSVIVGCVVMTIISGVRVVVVLLIGTDELFWFCIVIHRMVQVGIGIM